VFLSVPTKPFSGTNQYTGRSILRLLIDAGINAYSNSIRQIDLDYREGQTAAATYRASRHWHHRAWHDASATAPS
jgi:hypothetical protein